MTLSVSTDAETAFEIASAEDRRSAAATAERDDEIELKLVGLGNQRKCGAGGVAVDVYFFGQDIASGVSNRF